MLKAISKTFKGLVVGAVALGFVVMPMQASAALTQDNINAIIGLLTSFGADASTIANVQASLTGGTPVNTGGSTVTSCDTFGTTSIVRVGSRGENVRAIQRAMNQILTISGGSMAPLAVDGIFGPLTQGVVQYFQGIIGTNQDGVWGPLTQTAYIQYVANNCATDGTTPVVPGQNMVSLAASNPAAGTVIETQAAADMLHLTFSGNYTVTNVKLMRKGISTSSTLSNIYLFDGNTRVSDAATINSQGEVVFSQPSGLFSVNGVKTISVRADVANNVVGQTVGFDFMSAMAGDMSIAGSAMGNIFNIADAPSTMTGVSFGTVTPTGATLNPGNNVTLWQSVATVTNNNAYIDRLAFRQQGSAQASAFANFKLYVNGALAATAAGLDANGYVTFVPSAPIMLQSGSRVIRVDADIVSGASRTVQLSLRTAADAGIRDAQLGVNIAATGLPKTSAAVNTISGANGGTLTIEKDNTSATGDVTLNGTDVPLATYKLTAFGEPIKIETLRVGVDSSDDNVESLANGRIMIGGNQYGSTTTLNETDSVATGTSYTLNYTVYPGTPVMMEVRADLSDSHDPQLSASDTMTVSVLAGTSNAQRIDSLGTFNAPGAAVAANTVTVQSASMTLAATASYPNQTTSLPQTAFKIGSWALSGSSVEDILLNTLSIDVDEVTNTTFSEADLTNMYAVIKQNGNTVATTSPLATVAAADNNFSVSYNLMKNQNVTIELYATLGSTVTAADSFKTDLSVTGTSLTSGQTVAQDDKDGQTIIYGAGSLTVTTSAATPDSAKLADNQTVSSAKFKFEAVNSSYNVTDVTLTLANATNVQTVNLYEGDGSTLLASLPGQATLAFSGMNWNIPANQSKDLRVDLVLGNTGFGAGTSGASVLTTLTAATAVSGATGVSAAATESNPAGNAHYVYKAVPSITSVALPTTVLSNGTKTIAKFSVNTNGTGSIAWKQVLLDISKTGGAADDGGADPEITGVTLWNADTNTQITAAAVFQNADGDDAATCEETDTSCELLISVGTNADDNVEEQVSGSKTYEVRATISNTIADNDYIFASIDENLTYVANNVYTSVDNDGTVNDASFVWSDMSAQSHDTGTADWTNEALLIGLPTSPTWSMTK